MAQQHISIGTPPSGTDGDTVRTFAQKAEANFNELYSSVRTFKNKLINGNFDFWQRNTAFNFNYSNPPVAGGGFTADRWFINCGYCNTTVSQQGVNPGDTAGGATTYSPSYMQVTVAAVSDLVNCQANMIQRIEGVRDSHLRTMTVSLRVYNATAGNLNIGIEGRQNFGSGGSPSAQVNGISPGVVAIVPGWNYVTFTINFPSIAGKTLGTSGNDWYAAVIWFNSGTGYAYAPAVGAQVGTWTLHEVQLEMGSVATAFEARPAQVELAMCQRYFEKSYDVSIVPGTVTGSGAVQTYLAPVGSNTYTTILSAPFRVTKRIAPTVTTYSTQGASGKVRDETNGADITPVSIVIGTQQVLIGATMSAANTTLNIRGHWVADAEL